MRRDLPPLTELRAFEAAARHLSFKSAAAELGVTPTAISHQIRLLEVYCGQSLFRRRPRPLALTWAGEQLFPAVRDGLANFAEALSILKTGGGSGRLRVTATNAFAARWLVPRLPSWRAAYPRLRLDIIGTDAVLDLKAGEADVAVRYARRPPPGLESVELARDTFHVVGRPEFLGNRRRLKLEQLSGLPLIACEWPPSDTGAPTWEAFESAARKISARVTQGSFAPGISFREELHAIEALIAGQGVAICSDVLLGAELAAGSLRRLSTITLPGYGFHLSWRSGHPKERQIRLLAAWAKSVT